MSVYNIERQIDDGVSFKVSSIEKPITIQLFDEATPEIVGHCTVNHATRTIYIRTHQPLAMVRYYCLWGYFKLLEYDDNVCDRLAFEEYPTHLIPELIEPLIVSTQDFTEFDRKMQFLNFIQTQNLEGEKEQPFYSPEKMMRIFHFNLAIGIGFFYWKDTYRLPFIGHTHNVVFFIFRIQWGEMGTIR